jgi:hypothetical protein
VSRSDDWPPQDEHLHAALRHAPDRDLQPPAALSARILEQARRTVAPAAWPGRWLAWIMKPAGSAAFASVLLAGFIGLMWRDGMPPLTAGRETPAESAGVKSQRSVMPPGDAARGGSREATIGRQPVPAAPALPPSAKPRASPLAKLQRQEATSDRVQADDAPARLAESAAHLPKEGAGARASDARNDLHAVPHAPAAQALPPDPLDATIAKLRGAGAAGPSLETWTRLQAAARGRWQLLSDEAQRRGSEVRTPQGVLLGWLDIDSPLVRWQAVAEESVWQVEVPAALAEQLRKAASR